MREEYGLQRPPPGRYRYQRSRSGPSHPSEGASGGIRCDDSSPWASLVGITYFVIALCLHILLGPETLITGSFNVAGTFQSRSVGPRLAWPASL